MGTLSRLASRFSRDAHRSLLPAVFGQGHVSRWVLPEEIYERALQAEFDDLGHGSDAFGMNKVGLARGMAVTYWMYEYWFRVRSHDIEHVPATGPVILAANHGGMLPLDAMMICHDFGRNHPTNRAARVAMEYFVPSLPLVNLVFSRAGGVAGTRGNFHALLESGQVLISFPEGVAGIGKPTSEAYKLQRWSHGFAELAIRHQAPVVPTAVIGPDEQWPELARLRGVHLYGIPYLPIPATPLPLPVRYHLWYGEPIPVPELYDPEQASDAAAVGDLAERTRVAVQALLDHGVASRDGVFR